MSAIGQPTAALASGVTSPIAKVIIGGVPIPEAENVSVTFNAHYESDSWEATWPLYYLPKGYDKEFFASQSDLDVEIQVGAQNPDGSQGKFVTLFNGMVDDVAEMFDEGRLELRGRDFSGAFIDSIVTQNYQQQTSSQIAAIIAANHPQLTTQITQTSTPVGKYYNQVGSRLSRDESEWDFLTALAQFEGFVVQIRGKVFYFGPPPTPDTAHPFQVQYFPPANGQPARGNAEKVTCKRSLTLARDIKVVIQSMNRQTGKALKQTFTASNQKRGRQTGAKVAAQIYTYNIPGLTAAQAQQEAQSRAYELSRHERILEVSMPGSVDLTQDKVVQLIGTGTDNDQLFYIDRLEHTISAEDGYSMEFRGKNHSTYSTVPL